MTCWRNIALLLRLFVGPSVLAAQEASDTTPINIKLVNPATVESLPSWLRDVLGGSGCKIPQMHSDQRLTNIHRGHFVDSVTDSYALLCSRSGQSAVLIVTKDAGLAPPPILVRPDTSYLVLIQGGNRGTRREFARYLTPLTSAEVQRFCPLPNAEKAHAHNGIITFYQDREPTPYYFTQTTRTWVPCRWPSPE
jgi:hypothetical protein